MQHGRHGGLDSGRGGGGAAGNRGGGDERGEARGEGEAAEGAAAEGEHSVRFAARGRQRGEPVPDSARPRQKVSGGRRRR